MASFVPSDTPLRVVKPVGVEYKKMNTCLTVRCTYVRSGLYGITLTYKPVPFHLLHLLDMKLPIDNNNGGVKNA